MKILAVDLGYSSVKVCYQDENGVVSFEKFISAVAQLPKDGVLDVDDDSVFNLGPSTYIIGDSALKVSRSLLLPLENFDDLKKIYPIIISYLLKKFGTVEKCVIGLSLAFSDRADELLEYLYQELLIQDTSFFMLLPQGLACRNIYSTYGLNIRTESRNRTKLENYIIADLGFLTADFSVIIKNKSSAGTAVGIPCGVIKVAYDLADYLFKNYAITASVKECQNIIDSGGQFQRRGRKMDLSKEVKEFSKKYIGDVLTSLENNYSEFLDAIDGVLILGGGGYIFKNYIVDEKDEDVIKEVEKHFSLNFLQIPDDLSEYYNAYAYLRFAEQKLNIK